MNEIILHGREEEKVTERDVVSEKDVEGSWPIFFSRNSCTESVACEGDLSWYRIRLLEQFCPHTTKLEAQTL
jgi:hypothetical protein